MKKNKDDLMDRFDSKFKAICHALWMTFKYRRAKLKFGVIKRPNNTWASLEDLTAIEIDTPFFEPLPKDLSEMTYRDIASLNLNNNLLPHFEQIRGMLSTMDSEILRYILVAKIPLERFIRTELANRGYDQDARWVGFEKANDIWLT